jgi:hypothetical protein
LSQGNATAIPFATILQECAFVLSPWLSLRSGFALAIAAVLMAACVAGGSQGSRSAPVLKGALNMGVPAGYCIDRAASREAQDSAVVIMGRCADNVKALPAVLTVSVGQAGTAGAMAAGGQALASFFTSEEGRATLSRDGRASSVQVVEAPERRAGRRLLAGDSGPVGAVDYRFRYGKPGFALGPGRRPQGSGQGCGGDAGRQQRLIKSRIFSWTDLGLLFNHSRQ